MPDGRPAELIDLPGSYSLEPNSPDEEVTRNVITGRFDAERNPDAIVIVLDAANLDNHLRFALEVIALGRPVVVALNMMDLAERDGLTLVRQTRESAGVPVVPTVAVRRKGLEELKAALDGQLSSKSGIEAVVVPKERDHGLRNQAQKLLPRPLFRKPPANVGLSGPMRCSCILLRGRSFCWRSCS